MTALILFATCSTGFAALATACAAALMLDTMQQRSFRTLVPTRLGTGPASFVPASQSAI